MSEQPENQQAGGLPAADLQAFLAALSGTPVDQAFEEQEEDQQRRR